MRPSAMAKRFYDTWNARDLDGMFELLHEDVTISIDSGTIHGAEAARQYVMGVMHAFPGVMAAVHRVVAETADTVVTELRLLNPADATRDETGDSNVGTWRLAGLTCEIMEVRGGRITAVTNYYAPNEADRTDVELIPSRAEAARIAEEQAALRRVATLVARGVPQEAVFAAVNQEIARIVGADTTALMRFEADGSVTLLAAQGVDDSPFPVGERGPLDPALVEVLESGRPTRLGPGVLPIGALVDRGAGPSPIQSLVGVPISVDGRTWGVSFASTGGREAFPDDTEARIAGFTELVGTALVNAQRRAELQQMADEQAALRRVAELVARGAAPDELFASVAVEASQLIDNEATTLVRFDDDSSATAVAVCGGWSSVGARIRMAPDGDRIAADVLRTARPQRVDNDGAMPGAAPGLGEGSRSSVGVPIVLQDKIWGVLGAAATTDRRLPAEAEQRLQQFAELVSAALANAQARADVHQLAEEQAALRRVAELVARDVDPERVLDAVVAEASHILGDIGMALSRYEPGGGATIIATCRTPVPVGLRVSTEGQTSHAQVLRTGRAFRASTLVGTPLADIAQELGVDESVGVPVIVGARVWGVLTTSIPGRRLPPDTEERLAQFADMVGTAVANAESRAQLTASRARVVAAADESRRGVQRDVHDGAQQRLVQTVITLKLAKDALEEQDTAAAALLDEALFHAEQATAELRDLVHGILPASLTRGGLRAGLESLTANLSLPVDFRVSVPRMSAQIETTAYFVVAEALTNAVKHAGATKVEVDAAIRDGALRLQVRDDGAGGADPVAGSGLMGLFDRVEATEGTLTILSPPGSGTVVEASLPLE